MHASKRATGRAWPCNGASCARVRCAVVNISYRTVIDKRVGTYMAASTSVLAGGVGVEDDVMSQQHPDDADLARPEPGAEMVGPDVHGLYEGEQLVNDARFQTALDRIEADPSRFDPEAIRKRRAEREAAAEPATSSGATSEPPVEETDDTNKPDIINYGFCKLVYDFLDALHKRFPKRKTLQRTLDYYWSLVERAPAMPYLKFKEFVDQCEAIKADVFEERTVDNEAIVLDYLARVPMFRLAKIHRVYCPQLDEDTKVRIWAYVQRLVQVTKLMSRFSPRLRTMINSVSLKSMQKVQRGADKRNIDINALLEELQTAILDDDDLVEQIAEIAAQQV